MTVQTAAGTDARRRSSLGSHSSQRQSEEEAPEKLSLNVLPRTTLTRKALEARGLHPYLTLNLRPHKSIRSILNHLEAKWKLGRLMLRPDPEVCSALLRGMCWTVETVEPDLRAWEVFKGMKCPEGLFQMRYDLVSEIPQASQTPSENLLTHAPGATPPPEVTELASVTRTRSDSKRRRSLGPDPGLEQDGQSRELFQDPAEEAGALGPAPPAAAPEALLPEKVALDTCDGFFQNLLEAPSSAPQGPQGTGGADASESLFRQELSKAIGAPGEPVGARGEAAGALVLPAGCGRDAAGDSQGSTNHPPENPAFYRGAPPAEAGDAVFATPGRAKRRRKAALPRPAGQEETSLDVWQFDFGDLPGCPVPGAGEAAAGDPGGGPAPDCALEQSSPPLRISPSADSNLLSNLIHGHAGGCSPPKDQGQGTPEATGDGTPCEAISLPSPFPTPPSADHDAVLAQAANPGAEGESLLGGFSIGIDTLLGVDDASPCAPDATGALPGGPDSLPHHQLQSQAECGAGASCIVSAEAQQQWPDRPFRELFQ